MEDKNYYMDEQIGVSGVANTRNPIYVSQEYTPFEISGRRVNVGDVVTPTSKYDETLGNLDAVRYGETTVDDLRAKQQSGLEMAGNALANNIVIAGTTIIGGTLGLVNGIFSAIGEGDVSKLWDNEVNNWVTGTQEATREALPIYRGQQYEDKSLFQKLGTGIFWADLVQNLGFAEGMLVQGLGMAKVLSSVPSIVRGIVPSLTSSIGEASIEAVNTRNDERDNKIRIANSEYNRMASEATSPFALGILDSEYNKVLDDIDNDSRVAGNFVFGSNIALLTMSNSLQFGNLFSRGFGTAKRLKGALRREADGVYSVSNPAAYLVGTGAKKLLDATSEGIEEVSQGVISNTSSNYADYNTFNSSIFNPDKRELVANVWQALGESFSQALQDPETGVEFASGFLIGALGIPTIRKGKFPIGLVNNAGVEMYETYKELQRQGDLADKINSRIQNDKGINAYYNGLVRHLSIQDRMNAALDNDDIFDYKTSESAQFISDIMMFDEAGDLDNLRSIINNSIDLSDEGINSIIENTTTDGEGPFIYNGNPIPKEDVKYLLEEKIGILNSKIDNYVKDKEILESSYPNIDKETLSNALFLKQQFRDHSSRYETLLDSSYSRVSRLINSFPEDKISNKVEDKALVDSQGKSASQEYSSLSKDEYTRLLNNPIFTEYITTLLEDDTSSISYDERQTLKSDIEDISKLQESLFKINTSLREILVNPTKSAKDLDKIKKREENADKVKKTKNLKLSLQQVGTVAEFSSILENYEDDLNIKDSTVKELIDEGNPVAKTYQEMSNYRKDVLRAINLVNTGEATKSNAINLFQHQFENSGSLDNLANPDSIYINDFESLYDDSLTEDENITNFQEALHTLQTAMSRVNNDNKFKDRFSEEYKKPVERREGLIKGNSKEETGDSRTSTVPPVNNRVTPTQPERAVGNITQDEVAEDNKATNNAAPTTRELDKVQGQRPYYRPAIPELHIDASREGDFRPFYQVVAERESNADFSEIYNYLRDAGAFDYLNASNLREGSELVFVIDPNFNDHTIFIVDKSNRQIVGSLDEGDRSVSRYIGLRELIDNIHKEFEGRENKESKSIFIATPTTRVSKVMIGKIPYGTETRSLAEIPGVLDGDKAPIFGIVKNGTLTTNDKVDDNLIIKPVDMSNKEGRLYLLIPNGAGRYSPAAVRVKHFNSEEFNLDDASIASTPMGKSINSAIDRLASASSQDGVSEAMKDLAQEIHMQDVIITWFDSPSGNGIVVSRKVRNADGSYKMITINGKEQIQESKTSIYYNEKGLATVGDFKVDEAAAIASGYDPSIVPLVPKNPDVIRRSIVNTLQSMNLPLQVSAGRINSSGYNKRIINSGITTSNILEARTLGTWFTTDYFDKEGNLHQAISPASVTPEPRRKVETPVGGKESAIEGIPITSIRSGKSYYIDLKTNTIRDNQGQIVDVTPENRILFDIAWADSNYGDATVGYNMMDNKVILPNGVVLNRSTQKYITGDEAKNFKATLERTESDRKTRIADSKRVIGEIEESQRRVDKSRTDGEFYYILEDDGQYHEYTRVHSRLGSNSIESPKLVEEINKVKVELQRLVDSPANYDSYLTTLSNRYDVDLSPYKGMTDVKSRETIANIVRDSRLGSNSQRALEAGSAIDSVIRQFFTLSDTSSIVRPENISEEAFTSLINSLIEVKSNLEQRGETFLTNNIVLFHQYTDGSRIAGEVDILAVDKDGNFKIYDVKTSKHSFYKHKNSKGQEVDYFSNRAYWQRLSQRDYYTQQLSAYKNLFESQYGAPVTQLAIMPFVLGYSDNTVSSITAEKGIPINYSASTPVPLAQRVEPIQASDAPIFNSTLELQNPVNSIDENSKVVLPNRSVTVGYYEMEGKLHKGYLTEIGSVAGVKLHVMKIPNITTGYGKAEAHVASASYGVVFPNGQTVIVLKNSSTDTDASAVDKVFKALEKNPNRVVEESSKETILSKSVSVKQEEQSSASTTVQREQSVMEQDSEFEDILVLREVTSLENLWDRDSELAWLDRVLPQMSREDRVRIHEGLIKASGNRLAWGAFTNGLMILSDQAAEGTVYHEAFHVVSNTILSEKQRAGIHAEARKTFGNLSDLEIEEALAEDFRVWMQNGAQDTRTLGRKILDFFKELLSFLSIQPSLVSFYVNINKGKYSDYIINDRVAVTLLRRKYTPDPTMKGLDAEFDRVKESIRTLNNTRVFQTEREAYDAFIGKGLSPEFYRGVTRYNPNNAKGFKIKTFTSEEYEQFRDSIKEEMEFYKTESAPVDEGFYKFDSLDPDIQMDLLNKGWTKEELDSKSPIERERAVECISF